jgi:hypothetical protein
VTERKRQRVRTEGKDRGEETEGNIEKGRDTEERHTRGGW